ncbi:excalibur calcium-binding domain-containing protein [Streptomyces sp. Isolate_45]|uniref:excalibur calcium-binding domain-containing protein n=1 Tax=Streptomyces sp. Isolate_45 TaxID=2950111 RepID=UPI002481E8DE|nr:excalibur calcium-binding domain-containing protein [Streptomyces sp. Isolate_45]MDA5280889.1 excalibur calcium-binding domain-containing protein [Streptomyces sp. Isolate_45]
MTDQSRTIHKSRDHRLRPGRRTAVAAVGVIAALTLTACAGSDAPKHTFDVAPYLNKGHVADCDAFKAQADAQAVLRADALDPNELDRDGDGIACPNLPKPKDKKPVHRDYMTDLDGAPIAEPVKPSTT